MVKVLCDFPLGRLMFATENLQTEIKTHPVVDEPCDRHDSSGKIIVKSPSGDRAYTQGDTVSVAWQTANITGNVEIRLEKSDGSGHYILSAGTPYNASPYVYQFKDATNAAGDYYFSVIQGNYYGNSENFSVVPPGNWQNRIISISSLSRNIGEDKSYEMSGISIEFNDTDRYFRNMMSSQYKYIAGRKVRLFSSDDQLIYTGNVEKWQFSEDGFSLSINDKLSGLDNLITTEIVKGPSDTEMASQAEGQVMPIIYGIVDEPVDPLYKKGSVKCWKMKNKIFLLANHHCKEVVDNCAYLEDGTKMTFGTGEGLDNNADGNALIKFNSIANDIEVIYVNVKGKMDANGNLIEDPIEAFKDILKSYTSFRYNVTAMNQAQAVMQEKGYEIAGVIDKPKSLKDFLVDFCFSFDCDFFIGKGNDIIITLLDWSHLDPVDSFIEAQILDFQLNELPEEIRNKIQYMYRYDFGREIFLKTPIFTETTSATNWGEFFNYNEPINMYFVRDDAQAYDVVQRYVIQRKNPRRVAQFSVPLSEFLGLDISDVIEVQHRNAIDETPRKYQIRRVDLDFLSDNVQVEAVDVSSMSGGVFILGDRTTLPLLWNNASSNQRNYGYMADRATSFFSNNIDFGKVLY